MSSLISKQAIGTLHSTGIDSKVLKTQVTKTDSKLNPRISHSTTLTPRFSSPLTALVLISAMSVLNTPLSAAQSWTLTGQVTLSNAGTIDTVTVSTGDAKVSAELKQSYNDLIIDNGVTLNHNSSDAIVTQESTITNITNNGTIESNNRGVYFNLQSQIGTFTNTGNIISKAGTEGAVAVTNSTVTTFSNNKTIKSTNANGIKLVGATIDSFTNKGTIESSGNSGNNSDSMAGIRITNYTNNPSTIKTISNEGLIKAKTNGIFYEAGNNVESIVNRGTIQAEEGYGISIRHIDNSGKDNTTLGKIILESKSIIESKKDAVSLNIQNGKTTKVGGIELKKGATLKSAEGAGIAIAPNNYITGDINIEGKIEAKVGISNQGNINAGITSSSDAPLSIVNSGNAKITGDITNKGSGSLKLINEGNAYIGANLKNEGNGNFIINNTGKIGDKTTIESNGSGKVEVERWLVSTNSKGEVKPIEITGKNLSNVRVSNLTFDTGKLTDLRGLVKDPNNVIKIDVSKDTSINDAKQVTAKIFGTTKYETTDESGATSVKFDALTNSLTFSIDSAKTSAAALGKTLLSNNQSRNTFVNNVMGNAMNAVNFIHNRDTRAFNTPYSVGERYARADFLHHDASLNTQERNHLAFMLPYVSKSKISLEGGLTTKGHTKGVIFGYSYFNPNNRDIYGVYGGYDDFRSKTSPKEVLTFNNRTYYGGLRYHHPFNIGDIEFFSKFSSQLGYIQNDISETVGVTEFSSKPNSYVYGSNINVGMNIALGRKNTLAPEIGIDYNGGYSKAYTLSNKINTITRRAYSHQLNLFKTKASLAFYRDWNKHFKTLIYSGIGYTLNPNVKNPQGRYSNIGHYGGGKSKLDDLEASAGTTFVFVPYESFYFSLNYGINLTKNTTMHTGYAKFNYLW